MTLRILYPSLLRDGLSPDMYVPRTLSKREQHAAKSTLSQALALARLTDEMYPNYQARSN